MAGATVGDLELLQKMMVQALTERVKADMEDMIGLQMTWLAVSVADGATESDKKLQIIGDIAELKTKYAADKVVINQKYL